MGSLRGTASSGGLPSSVDKNGLAANVVESPSSLVSDAVLTSQEPRHRLSEKSTGYDEIPEPILQSSSSNSKLKENREADAPSTSARLLYDSDEDLFNCRPKATAPLPSSMEPQIKSPLILSPGAIPSTVEKKTSTVPVNSGSGAKAVLKVKSYAANSLFDDSDDESLFGNSVKPIPSARTSTLLSDAPALDRPAEICHAKNEAPQVSETKYSENHDETRPVSNFSSLSHKPSLLSPDLSIKPFDVSPESGPFDADVASTADSQPATSETLNIEARRTQEPENLLSHAAQRTKDVGSELPAALNRSTSPFLQARTVSDILESSDDDDLFSPRDQSIIPSKPIAQERTSVPKTKDNLKEAAYHEGFLSEGGSDIKNRSLLSNQPTFIGNEPIGSDASNEEVSVEKNVTLGLYANTLESSDLVNIAARPNEITRPTKEEPPPVPVKSVLRPKVDESNSKSDDPHGSVPTEKAVPGFLSESSQSSELESAVQDTKVDRPSSNFSTTESRSSEKDTPEKETSEVDGNHVAKVIEKTVENVRAGRIAALKLSLSQQPNALRFPSPGSQPGSSSDGDGTINNLFKKPFGGVPLFRPPITSSAKRRSPENTESNPSSPANSERSLLAKPAPDSVLEGAAKGVVESVTDTNPDSLGCVGRTRPRLPSSRRPPTRTFRRSRILENESVSGSRFTSSGDNANSNLVYRKRTTMISP